MNNNNNVMNNEEKPLENINAFNVGEIKIAPQTTIKCCEVGCNNISNINYSCNRCKKNMCISCYDISITRKDKMKFYSSYDGWCDQCIWWDLG